MKNVPYYVPFGNWGMGGIFYFSTISTHIVMQVDGHKRL